MTKAEIDDIFGEFEIDEDYMIKSKDVIGLFVAVKEEPKAEEPAPAPVEEAPAEEDEGDAQKNMRKSERHVKELIYQQEEDRKNHERMQALVDQMQSKIKTYKKQIEEAEEIAALNLAKFRQVQSNVSIAMERADINEQSAARFKARARSSSIGPA